MLKIFFKKILSYFFLLQLILHPIYGMEGEDLAGPSASGSVVPDALDVFQKSDQGYEEFYERIGYQFNNPQLLTLAITHNQEDIGGTLSSRGNERFEFLGDAVLEVSLKQQLWAKVPITHFHELPQIYSELSKNESLAEICDYLGLDRLATFPSLSSLPRKNPKRNPILDAKADRLEALVGAMYLDGGLAPVNSFVTQFWFRRDDSPYARLALGFGGNEGGSGNSENSYQFSNTWMFLMALKKPIPSDFLGEGIFKWVMAEYFYRRFPQLPEGELAKKLQVVTKKQNLPTSITVDTMPIPTSNLMASIGAIYLDAGLEKARSFILWHWTSLFLPPEIEETLQRDPVMPTSESFIIYPPLTKGDTPPKNLLIEVLRIIGEDPTFDTPSESSPMGFTSTTSFLNFKAEGTSAQKREAEKKASQKGLETLAIEALLEMQRGVDPLYPEEFYLRLLETHFRMFFGGNFNYHLIAEHPQESAYRVETQGYGVGSFRADGKTLGEAKYKSLANTLIENLGRSYRESKKSSGHPILTLDGGLEFYRNLCFKQIAQKLEEPEIIPLRKAPDKVTPLLTYEIKVGPLSAVGEGYSQEMATLDAMVNFIKEQNL